MGIINSCEYMSLVHEFVECIAKCDTSQSTIIKGVERVIPDVSCILATGGCDCLRNECDMDTFVLGRLLRDEFYDGTL